MCIKFPRAERSASLPVHSCLSNLRTLTLLEVNSDTFFDSASNTAALSSLGQLERLSVDFHSTCASMELTFPNMPRLHTVSLVGDHSVFNLDCARVLHLSDLTIHCNELREVLLPASILRLKLLATRCYYPQALSSVANLPNLVLLDDPYSVVLSRPPHELCFTSTVTTYHTWRLSAAVANLDLMTHLSCLRVTDQQQPSPADVTVIAALPSLTSLLIADLHGLTISELAPFGQCSLLKHLHVGSIPSDSLAIFALPNLTSLELACYYIDSLAPLAACINLTHLHAQAIASEQDAKVIAGLTKLETLRFSPISQDCFTHICRLPRLRVLNIQRARVGIMGPVSLQALTGLAPTLEELSLPRRCGGDHDQIVLAVTQLTKLRSFTISSQLTAEQVSALRSSLPRLYELLSG